MTNEEAIKGLLNVKMQMSEETPFTEAVDLAVSALEKQIPKKPKYVEVEQDAMDMETGEEYTYKIDEAHCSCCDFIIGADNDIFDEHYCEWCGQKLDWSDGE